MTNIYQEEHCLLFSLNGETMRIEPWGRDSLRVRATCLPQVREDWASALLPPRPLTPECSVLRSEIASCSPASSESGRGAPSSPSHFATNTDATAFPTTLVALRPMSSR